MKMSQFQRWIFNKIIVNHLKIIDINALKKKFITVVKKKKMAEIGESSKIDDEDDQYLSCLNKLKLYLSSCYNAHNIKQVYAIEKGNDILEVAKEKLLENKVRVPTKAVAIAPLILLIPTRNTGMGPKRISLFRA